MAKESNNMDKEPGYETVCVQDPDESQDLETLTSENTSVDYHRTIAERRRLALAEALEENEQLHKQIKGYKSEIDALRKENAALKPLAEETVYLAGVLKDLTSPNDEEKAAVDQSAEAKASES